MRDVFDIALYVVAYCTKKGTPVSNLQLQKILYYLQLNFYRFFDEPAFNATFEAWEYGPVVPEVYRKYSIYGAAKIYDLKGPDYAVFLEKQKRIADLVIDKCVSISAWDLVERSHKKGGPWHDAYVAGEKRTIDNEIIRKYASGT